MIAVSIFFLEVAIWTGRWKVALKYANHDIDFWNLYWISHGGKFVTNVTPIMKAGGEPFRAYFAKKTYKVPYDIGFGTLLAETAISIPIFLSFLTTGLVTWLYLTASLWTTILVAVIMGSLTILIIPFILWLVERETAMKQVTRLINWISEKIGRDQNDEEVEEKLKNLYKSIQFVLKNKKAGFLMVILSVILYSATIVRFYIIFLALGINVAWYIPLIGSTAPFILGMIPFSPGGLIFVEGGMMGIFMALGLSNTAAASTIMVERGISYFISTIAGGIAASYLGVKIWKK